MTNNTQASQQVPSGMADEQLMTIWKSVPANYDSMREQRLAICRAIEAAVLAAQPSQAGGDGAKDAERLRTAIIKMLEQPNETFSDGKALAAMVKIRRAAIAAGKHKGE